MINTAYDGRVVDGRDDDFVDVFFRKRLGCREVARDILRGSGGREGARQPEEDDAAALAALREAHGLPIVEKLTEDYAS